VKLLVRWGVDEALIGDLTEQRAAGRSAAWFWRQVIAAVVWRLLSDLIAHPIRATLAVLMALLLRRLTFTAWAMNGPTIDMHIGDMLLAYLPLGRQTLLLAVATANAVALLPIWFAIGWMTARVSPGASLLFLVVSWGVVAPTLARQLAFASAAARPVLGADLAMFAISLGGFTASTCIGAAYGTRLRSS